MSPIPEHLKNLYDFKQRQKIAQELEKQSKLLEAAKTSQAAAEVQQKRVATGQQTSDRTEQRVADLANQVAQLTKLLAESQER